MSEQWVPLLSAGAGVAGALLMMDLLRVLRSMRRDFMEALPLPLLLIWPLVKTVEFVLEPLIPPVVLKRLEAPLQQADLQFLLSPAELTALQLTLGGLLWFLAAICADVLGAGPFHPVCVSAGFAGFILPMLSLRDRRLKREHQLVRDLPVFLDFVVMGVEAGLNLTGGLQQAAAHGPAGPLNTELNRILRDIRAGSSRSAALKAMAERLSLSPVSNLTSAILQIEASGGSLADTLRMQVDKLRNERFLRAEKLAMQAPVKLVFPLVAFVFPVTFLFLGFPIAMKFMHGI